MVPRGEFIWSFQGEQIQEESDRYSILEEASGPDAESKLIIHKSQKSDFGTYQCMAANSEGKTVFLIDLKAKGSLSLAGITVAVILGVALTVGCVLLGLYWRRGARCPKIKMEQDRGPQTRNVQVATNGSLLHGQSSIKDDISLCSSEEGFIEVLNNCGNAIRNKVPPYSNNKEQNIPNSNINPGIQSNSTTSNIMSDLIFAEARGTQENLANHSKHPHLSHTEPPHSDHPETSHTDTNRRGILPKEASPPGRADQSKLDIRDTVNGQSSGVRPLNGNNNVKNGSSCSHNGHNGLNSLNGDEHNNMLLHNQGTILGETNQQTFHKSNATKEFAHREKLKNGSGDVVSTGTMYDYQHQMGSYPQPVNYYANSIFLGPLNGEQVPLRYKLSGGSENNFYHLFPHDPYYGNAGNIPPELDYSDLQPIDQYSQQAPTYSRIGAKRSTSYDQYNYPEFSSQKEARGATNTLGRHRREGGLGGSCDTWSSGDTGNYRAGQQARQPHSDSGDMGSYRVGPTQLSRQNRHPNHRRSKGMDSKYVLPELGGQGSLDLAAQQV